MLLTSENYSRGLLVDDDLMGGVSESPDQPGSYLAFVLRHTTGEYLGYQSFPTLEEALQVINQVQRSWKFEAPGGCGGGNCGTAGSCDMTKCGGSRPCGGTEVCPL